MKKNAALFLAITACTSDPLTEVVVTIEPEQAVRSEVESVEVEITPARGGAQLYLNSSAPWKNDKLVLVLAPESERAAELYRLEVRALRNGQPFAVARLISGYVLGETRYVRVRLEEACGATCDVHSTCYLGGCVDARVDPLAFASRAEGAPESGGVLPPTIGGGDDVPDPFSDASTGVPSLDAGSAGALPADSNQVVSTDPTGSNPATPDAGTTSTRPAPDAAPAAPPATTPPATTPPTTTSPAPTPPAPAPSPACTEPSPAACSEAQRCEAGAMAACHRLAIMYDSQTAVVGIPKDDARAAQLYARACGGGEQTACSTLGVLHVQGRGIARDVARAVALFNQACTAGVLSACDNLGWHVRQGDGVAADPVRALDLFTRACNGNVPSGCFNLAVMYMEGRGTAVDLTQAVPLFVRACGAGHGLACREAGRLYEAGRGVARDPVMAQQLLMRACSLGVSDACSAPAR